MNNKITMSDLAELLAQKSKCSKKEADLFLKEFFGLATEVISKGEELNINGLGSFKLVWVEKRSSVNIQTGLPFEIPEHYKLTFSPDKNLRDAVNAPFSCFETEILPDDVMADAEILDEEEDDDDILDFGENVPNEDAENTLTGSKDEIDGKNNEKKEPLPKEKEDKELKKTITPLPISQIENPFQSEMKREFKHRFGMGYVAGFLSALLLGSLVVLGWLYYDRIDSYKEVNLTMHPMTVTIKKDKMNATENKDSLSVVEMMVTDSIRATAVLHRKTDEPEKVVERTIDKKDEMRLTKGDSDSLQSQKEVADEVKIPITEIVKPGTFLTTISLKYYGNKTFWVYIYEENRAKIQNPNNVPIGTVLEIPDPDKYGINSKNKESVEKAKALAEEILKRYEK